MKNKKYLKIAGIILAIVVAVCAIGFFAYVSDYYDAKAYEVGNIEVSEGENYTIYGNTNSEKGLIFYQGAKVEEKAYEPILSKLAEKGICCVLVHMPYNLAVLDLDAAGDVMEKFTGIDSWYIAGHSLGGAMAASFAATNQDDFEGLILLAAYPTDDISVPVLSIYGSEDGVLNKEKYDSSIGLAKKLTEVVIEGGNHAQFGNYGEQAGDKKATISNEKQWDETVEQIMSFIK